MLLAMLESVLKNQLMAVRNLLALLSSGSFISFSHGMNRLVDSTVFDPRYVQSFPLMSGKI